MNTVKHIRTLDIKPIDDSKTYVITMVSNPARFRSRYDAYRVFEQHMKDSGAQLVTVEVAYGERQYEVTDKNNPMHVQLRTEHEEVWLKEAAWNRGLKELYKIDADWRYVIFLDADIRFVNPTWLSETIHQLQSHMVVHPFAHALDIGPNHEVLQTHAGFGYMYHKNMFQPPKGAGYTFADYYGATTETGQEFWHPGYGLAFRREVFEGATLGGGGNSNGPLLTAGVLGASDHHMMLSMVGCAKNSLPGNISDGYRKAVMSWQEDAERVINRDIGYTPGSILHTWGGSKKKRFYVERWNILTENQFDPFTDIRWDWQGLPQLVVTNERQRRLRDLFRAYFRARDEDGQSTD